MNSVFIDLAAELQALLQSPAIVGVAEVTRDRQFPVIKQATFIINVKLDKSRGAIGGVTGSPTDWATDFIIECYARANALERPTEVVDPLLIAVWQRLSVASAYAGLIALGVQDVLPDPEIQWDLGEGDTPLIAALISTRIVHRTNPGSLTAWTGKPSF